MKIKLGVAPDSWGIWFPSDPKQMPWQRCFDEMAQVGFKWVELGPYGYLPTDPAVVRAELAARRPEQRREGFRQIGGRLGASSLLGPLNGQMWTFIHLACAAAALNVGGMTLHRFCGMRLSIIWLR